MDNPIRGAKITENIKMGFKENLIFQWTQASESVTTGVLLDSHSISQVRFQ